MGMVLRHFPYLRVLEREVAEAVVQELPGEMRRWSLLMQSQVAAGLVLILALTLERALENPAGSQVVAAGV